MKLIALYNIKGGVGKTASAVNLAYLSSIGPAKTLLCDLDPQGSASYYFRIRSPKKFNSKKFLKGGKFIDKYIRETDFENLDLLPSKMSHRKMDLFLNNLPKSKTRFKNIFSGLSENYEYIFLDCPPNITLVSENIFVAADHILIPLIPTTLSMLTYEKLLKFFKNRKLKKSKLLPFFCMVEYRKRMHREIIENQFLINHTFLKSRIPYSAEIEKMGLHRSPLVYFKPKSKAAEAYQNLWQEINNVIRT